MSLLKGFKSLFAQVSSCMAHWGYLSGKLERQQTCKKRTNKYKLTIWLEKRAQYNTSEIIKISVIRLKLAPADSPSCPFFASLSSKDLWHWWQGWHAMGMEMQEINDWWPLVSSAVPLHFEVHSNRIFREHDITWKNDTTWKRNKKIYSVMFF